MSWLVAGLAAGSDLVTVLLWWVVVHHPLRFLGTVRPRRWIPLLLMTPVAVGGWTGLIHSSPHPWAFVAALPLSVYLPALLVFLFLHVVVDSPG